MVRCKLNDTVNIDISSEINDIDLTILQVFQQERLSSVENLN